MVVTNPTGLHARPAVRLARLAAGFDADVEIRADEAGEWVRARSTARVMKLKAGARSVIHLRAEGAQADAALSALVDFVRRDFDEGPAAATPDAAGQPNDDAREDADEDTSEGAGGSGAVGAAGGAVAGGRTISAVVASPGLAIGVLHVLARSRGPVRDTGDPEIERAVLDEAVARSLAELRELVHGSGELAADVIGFQIGLLEDEEFLEPVRVEIESGTAAVRAWTRHLAGEITDYESAPTGYLRERAADLRDLRDRVAAALGGEAQRGGQPDHDPSGDGLPGHASGDGLSGHGPPGHDQPESPSPGSLPPSHDLSDHCLVIADELTPSRFLEIDWSRAAGAATYSGSPASHVAMLARAQGVPMLVQLSGNPGELTDGTEAILDAERGCLVPAPPPPIRERYVRRIDEQRARKRAALRYVSRPARTRDGSPVRVLVNVDAPSCLDSLDPSHCDGIGLTRTEFLFHGAKALPGEDTQLRFYRRLATWAGGRPVTVRTLDAGGDKPIPGLTPEGESNPFLGLRGVRLSLARPEVLATQLRALARAAAGGGLRVMLPMVTAPDELHEVRRLLAAEVEALRAAGIEAAAPSLGMMVEVPAAALTIETFDADFFSIGTNDLTQYVLAAGRDSTAVADLLDPLHPAVLELIARVAGHGARNGREVSVCGEMAACPEGLRALLDAGIRTFSVPPPALASTKAALAAL